MIQSESNRPSARPAPASAMPARENLPPPNTSRWVIGRKAAVVTAVNTGILSVSEACQRYGLSLEELASWQRAVEREGAPGLRVARVQHHRQMQELPMRRR